MSVPANDETPRWECPTCFGAGKVLTNPYAPPPRHDLKPGETPPPGTVPPKGFYWKMDRAGRVTQHKPSWWGRLSMVRQLALTALGVFLAGVAPGVLAMEIWA